MPLCRHKAFVHDGSSGKNCQGAYRLRTRWPSPFSVRESIIDVLRAQTGASSVVIIFEDHHIGKCVGGWRNCILIERSGYMVVVFHYVTLINAFYTTLKILHTKNKLIPYITSKNLLLLKKNTNLHWRTIW